MAWKDTFGADWERVVGAPMLAGIAVTAAAPGGLVGALQESFAVAGAMRSAKGGGDTLAAEIAAAYETSEGRDMARDVFKTTARGKKAAEIVDAAVAELQAVARLVAEKAPDAAPGFKAWLTAIAARVAESGTEGGFLGFGGEKVSASEREAIQAIAEKLGVTV